MADKALGTVHNSKNARFGERKSVFFTHDDASSYSADTSTESLNFLTQKIDINALPFSSALSDEEINVDFSSFSSFSTLAPLVFRIPDIPVRPQIQQVSFTEPVQSQNVSIPRERSTSSRQGHQEIHGDLGVDDARRISEERTDSAVSDQSEDFGEEEVNVRRRRRGVRGGRKTNDDVKDERQTSSFSSSTLIVDSGDEGDDSSSSTVIRKRTRKRERVDEPAKIKGSVRMAARRQRHRDRRLEGRRKVAITEAEFLARRESVKREMLIREKDGLNQISVIEDGILVEHFVSRHTQSSLVGNIYVGRVQNVLPSMEAAFVDIGKGRNAVLYAGEVNWDAAGLEGQPKRIEQALKTGDRILVQVAKDSIGHKGARLTSQITLAGRYLVLVPSGGITGISRKLPAPERSRLKRILKAILPAEHGAIVRTAAEGATEEQLRNDVERLLKMWETIKTKEKKARSIPTLLKGEPELAVRVVRDVFNEDFQALRIQGNSAWNTIHEYISELSPDLLDRVEKWVEEKDIFSAYRVEEQLMKAFDRHVWLPSGGSLVIDRTEAMTVIDVNTGKFTGVGSSLEETVTKTNLEAAEEIVRQLRLRDIGGIVVIDFIDMVFEENRELVLRRLVECLGRDHTRHQVAEVTSLGLVQMTRKRLGQGLVEAFSTSCDSCDGRGYITYTKPVEHSGTNDGDKRYAQIRKNVRIVGGKENAKTKAAMNSIAAASSHQHARVDDEKVKESSYSSQSSSKHVNKEAKNAEKTVENIKEKQRKSPKSSSGSAYASSNSVVTPSSESKNNSLGSVDENGILILDTFAMNEQSSSAEQAQPAKDIHSEKKVEHPAHEFDGKLSQTQEGDTEKESSSRFVASPGVIKPSSQESNGILTFPL
ncbi:MAG: Rne/Rng family ribonuclease [Actinomycetaceae bacterium]|nr:Rne/Rng family ribonuclease [Actinomycetaceae bacterium]